jgi:hypothetical protein
MGDMVPDAGPASGTEHRIAIVPPTHPDAVSLTAARRAAYPHWAAGWDLDEGDGVWTERILDPVG